MIMGITGAVYGGFRYLLPLVLPFLLAYMTALWLRRPVRYLERKLQVSIRGKKYHPSAALIGSLLLLFVGAGLAGIFCYGSSRILQQFRMLSQRVPDWLDSFDRAISSSLSELERGIGVRPGALVSAAENLADGLAASARQLTMPILMENSMSILRGIIRFLIVLVVFYVAVVMTLSEMEELRERKSRSFFHREFTLFSHRVLSVGSAWLKTQAVIMTITSVLCSLGLFLIRNPYSLLIGLGIGFLDVLPFFGTGSVLIPWGLILAFQHQWMRASVLFGLYGICYLVREFLEARLMGSKMGLSSLETLITMYAGVELFGIPGFILGPMGLLLIRDLLDIYWEETEGEG